MEKCPYCNAWFNNKRAVNVHIGKVHKSNSNFNMGDPMAEIQEILRRYGVR